MQVSINATHLQLTKRLRFLPLNLATAFLKRVRYANYYEMITYAQK